MTPVADLESFYKTHLKLRPPLSSHFQICRSRFNTSTDMYGPILITLVSLLTFNLGSPWGWYSVVLPLVETVTELENFKAHIFVSICFMNLLHTYLSTFQESLMDRLISLKTMCTLIPMFSWVVHVQVTTIWCHDSRFP